MQKSNYSTIETIIKIAKKGGMFILVDDEKRENEGDLVISTSDTNSKNINNFAIGPEGGWSKEELKNFKFKFMLTEFNLRSETAAITALSLTM